MKRLISLALLVCANVFAQNAALMPLPKITFLDANGAPVAGGYLRTCVAGTSCTALHPFSTPSNPLATYTDSTAGTAAANPIVLDAGGSASVWLGSGSYKIVLTDANGVTLWTQDNVTSLQALKVNGSTFLNYTASGSSTVRTVASKLGDTVSVLDYGAKGDATTDDTAAIQAAINAVAAPGGTVYFPPARYKITTALQLKSNVHLLGAGAASEIDAIGVSAITNTVTETDYTTPPTTSGSTVQGATSLTVGQTSNVSVGDMIWMDNGGNFNTIVSAPNVEGDVAEQQEVFYVIATTSTTITLSRPTNFSYPSGTTVHKYTATREASVRNLKLVINSANPAITLTQPYHVTIDGNQVEGGGTGGAIIFSYLAYSSAIRNNRLHNIGQSTAIYLKYWASTNQITGNVIELHDVSTAGDSMITLYAGCNSNTVSSNTLDNYVKDGTIYGVIVHTKGYANTVSGNTIRGAGGGLATAYGSFRNTFSGNSVNSSIRCIALVDSREITVTGNSLNNCGVTADATSGGIALVDDFDISIVGNTVTNGRSQGIFSYGGASSRLAISGNTVVGTGDGIILQSSGATMDRFTITGNKLYQVGNGIEIFPAVNYAQIQGNTVAGNGTSHCVWLNGGVKNIVTGNILTGCVDGIRLQSTTQFGFVTENVATGNSGYGLRLMDAASAYNTIRQNNFDGNTTGRSSGELTSAPTTGVTDAGFTVYNGDQSSTQVVSGWRRIDNTTTGSAGWVALGTPIYASSVGGGVAPTAISIQDFLTLDNQFSTVGDLRVGMKVVGGTPQFTAGTSAVAGQIEINAGAVTFATATSTGVGNTATPATLIKFPASLQKAATGTRYLCIDTSGNVTSSATACSGT